MNRTLIIIMVVILALGIGSYFLFIKKAPAPNIPLKEGPIVAFGDSLVKGYGATKGNDFVSLLSVRTKKRIVNLGTNGDTTATALARLDKVTEQNPSVVIVLLGGNDYLRKVPIDTTFENLGIIVDQLKEDGAVVLLLGVRGGLLSDIYEERFETFAESKDIEYVPNVLDGLLGNDKYMSDAVHPNDAGYAKIADKVGPILEKMLGN